MQSVNFVKTGFLTALLVVFLLLAPGATAQGPAPASSASVDKLGRDNPQSSVTAFLQACRRQDYNLASQYIDLRLFSDKRRKQQGSDVAKRLEAALNSAPHFNAIELSRNPQGSSDDGGRSGREVIATLNENGQSYTLDLERVVLQSGGPQVWIFSPDTVVSVLNLKVSTTAPWLVHYLPGFLISVEFLETPIWKWLALFLAAIVLMSLSRHLDRLLSPLFQKAAQRLMPKAGAGLTDALLRPLRLLLSIALFRIVMQAILPSAVAGIYIGRALELLVAWSIVWCLLRIVDLFLNRLESSLAARHQFSGRSILRLGRRTASVTIVVVAILMLLSSWGYNTATLVAGLGVGGIAIALAAQQTIANIFGGVSVIGDRPVAIGDFGKFGDLIGTVEDIGMRSTQVRTLNRTLVSIPNATFAGANLENYSMRDKILFNPTFQINRNTADQQIWRLIQSLHEALQKNGSVELGPTPVRLTGLSAAAFHIEVFCYVLTPDIDEFYKTQGELLLTINEALQAEHLELV